MWHASIALYGPSGPLATERVDRKRRRLAAALTLKLLDGVGVAPTLEEIKVTAFHARRALSPGEIARLDPAWLAIEPVDMG